MLASARAPAPLNLEHASDRFADVLLQFIDGFALRITPGEGWNLAPITTFRIFMDDNGVIPHPSIFARGVDP